MKYKRKNRGGTGNDNEAKLTPRESLILSLIASGFSDKEIANSLSISWMTVKNHTKRVLYKLDVKSRAHAVVKVLRLGLLSFDGIEKTAEVYAAKAVAKTVANTTTTTTTTNAT